MPETAEITLRRCCSVLLLYTCWMSHCPSIVTPVALADTRPCGALFGDSPNILEFTRAFQNPRRQPGGVRAVGSPPERLREPSSQQNKGFLKTAHAQPRGRFGDQH
eukprot:15434973-Alexandrium_andersonii.AAC.3